MLPDGRGVKRETNYTPGVVSKWLTYWANYEQCFNNTSH